MRILVASDKFKGSLGAQAVGERIAAGLRAVLPLAQIDVIALADGGEGTAEAITRAAGGVWLNCAAHDALGRSIRATFGWFDASEIAVMEMSEAAGIARLLPNELNPLIASTLGVGEMLCAALARGAREVIIGLGGSATNDAGFGMARALGFRFVATDGAELRTSVEGLLDLSRIEPPNDLQLPRIIAACDVRNPLLGPRGATRVFARQKGAGPEQIEILERALFHLGDVAAATFGFDHRETAGAGAAGGLGFGLLTFCGAELRSGFEVVADKLRLQTAVELADIVITGEGKLDRQSLEGKAPAGVARMAKRLGKRVFAIVGQATEDCEVRELFEAVETLNDSSENFRKSGELLEIRAAELARRLSADPCTKAQ
jgi:glycerate kinase